MKVTRMQSWRIVKQIGFPFKILFNSLKYSLRRWSVRNNSIEFPILASGPRLKLTYRRSFGQPSLILLVLFLDHQEYLDPFVHCLFHLFNSILFLYFSL
jgi:hypothetical protein